MALHLPAGEFTLEGLLLQAQSEELVRHYLAADRRTLLADVQLLVKLGLVREEGTAYRANFERLRLHLAHARRPM